MIKIVAIVLIMIISSVFFVNFALAGKIPTLIDENDPNLEAGTTNVCDFIKVFIRASDTIIALAGSLAVIMFVYGGLVMITAYGVESRIQWGKSIIIATVVGIFIIMLAWTLINTIVAGFYGTNNGTAFFEITKRAPGNWAECSTKGLEEKSQSSDSEKN